MMRAYTHIYTHIHTHIYTHTYTHTYIHAHNIIYTHIYTHTYTHTHAQTHTCTPCQTNRNSTVHFRVHTPIPGNTLHHGHPTGQGTCRYPWHGLSDSRAPWHSLQGYTNWPPLRPDLLPFGILATLSAGDKTKHELECFPTLTECSASYFLSMLVMNTTILHNRAESCHKIFLNYWETPEAITRNTKKIVVQ